MFRISAGEALSVRHSAMGEVGQLFRGEGIALDWVSKQDEQVDPNWFSSDQVDLLLVLQGQLRVEFESSALASLTLGPLDLLVLPPKVRCRAYRWPRSATAATVFLAAYPIRPVGVAVT